MPFVHVHWVEGRDEATKAEMIKRITDVVVDVAGVKPESVWVRLEDMAKTDFGVGGTPKSQAS